MFTSHIELMKYYFDISSYCHVIVTGSRQRSRETVIQIATLH